VEYEYALLNIDMGRQIPAFQAPIPPGANGNYADGDHVQVHWGYRDEVRDSYFSSAYLHAPRTHDTDVFIADKTSGMLGH
jgi:hypothetical protein